MPKTAASKKKPATGIARADAVTETLRSYAARGVFREFSFKDLPAQRTEFRFVWLTPRPIHAIYDARANRLKLIDLLPGIESRSAMDKALRAFLAGRYSTSLPPHRRVSRNLLKEIKCTNRESAVSIQLLFGSKPGDSARQSVQLISEIFQNFLTGPYHEYMVLNFDIRED